MRRPLALLAACWVCWAFAAPAAAQVSPPDLPPTYAGDENVASTDDARAIVVNPAALGLRYDNELFLSYARENADNDLFSVLVAAKGFGLAYAHAADGSNQYGLAFAGGAPRLRFGWTPRWIATPGEGTVADQRLGVVSRRDAWLSAGVVADHVTEPKFRGERLPRTWTLGLALRPLALDRPRAHDAGTRFTVGADVTVAEDGPREAARVRVTAELEAIPGLLLRGTVADHREVRVSLTIRGVNSSWLYGTARHDNDRLYDFGAASLHKGQEPTLFAGRTAQRVAVVRAGGTLADEGISGGALLGGSTTVSSAPLHAQLVRALEDPLVHGVLLDLRGVSGMAQLEELRPRVQALRLADKPVVAFLEHGGGRGDLYLASACDRVVTTEEADFMGLGLRTERRWYRGMFERFGLRVDRASIGAYKSAFRNFSADSTPAADREVIERTLDQSQAMFVEAVSKGRHVPPERFAHVLDGRSWTAADLVAAGLADTVAYREDAMTMLKRLSGVGRGARGVNLLRQPLARREWARRSPVAVVYAGGGISTGRSSGDLLSGSYMGSETVTAQLEQAFRASDVKAVVLRVESPGGSALASNLIDHAVQRLKAETRKPCIVSMGSVAASGGYYISTHGDMLFADRYTRTGSIGVLYVKPSLEGFYAKQGVRQQSYERGAYMGGHSTARDWTPAFQAAADSAIHRNYDVFVGKVAEGRRLPVEQVLEIAQGRVWLGDDALERRLVDRIGGLEDAIAEARRRAHVPPREKIRLEEYHRPRAGLLARLVSSWVSEAVERELSPSALDGVQYRDDDWDGDADE